MGVKKQWSLEKGEKVQKMYDDEGRSFKAQISRNFGPTRRKRNFLFVFSVCGFALLLSSYFLKKLNPCEKCEKGFALLYLPPLCFSSPSYEQKARVECLFWNCSKNSLSSITYQFTFLCPFVGLKTLTGMLRTIERKRGGEDLQS